MAGALTGGLPPLPNPEQDQQQPGPQAPMQQPAPTHAQTVAALRHFSAISKELEMLLKDPDAGKADIKSKVIDGISNLVGMRIIPATQAVSQLSTLPDRPFEQRKWLQDHLTQAMQAESAVLDHHRASAPGTGNIATEVAANPPPDPDQHMATMNGMMQGQYAGR